jgi:hypothetical protein
MATFPHGATIAEALGSDCAYSTEVRMGGCVIPRSAWQYVKPKPDVPVGVCLYPQGGNGGKWIRIVAMVVLAYFSAGASSGMFATSGGMFAAGSTSAMMLSAGIMVVGSLALTPMVGNAREIHA